MRGSKAQNAAVKMARAGGLSPKGRTGFGICSLLALFLLPGCARPAAGPGPSSPGAAVPGDSNRAMAELLRRHFDSENVREVSYTSSNTRRLGPLREDWQRAPRGSAEELKAHVNYAVELVHATHYDEAIAELTALRAQLAPESSQGRKRYFGAVLDHLAIAHLLQGESLHRQRNPSPVDGILPIAGGGVHRDKEPARAAAAVYEEMLRIGPGDRTAMYLLNVAHQMIGDWPGGVPEPFRIPPSRFASDEAFPRFEDMAEKLGVAVVGHAGGVVMDDLDNDGNLDLMISSSGQYDNVKLLINRGDGTFEDRTEAAGLTGIVSGLNMTHADFDNDGNVDVLILRGGWAPLSGRDTGAIPCSLLRNDGHGHFTDVTAAAGIMSLHPRSTAVWFDYDNDGFLDLFLGNEQPPWWLPGIYSGHHPVELYRNQGDGTFKEVTQEAGLGFSGWVKGATAGDFNNDGYPDLYVSLFIGDNRLYENRLVDGKRKFVDVTKRAGVAAPYQGFPTWFFDYDNDGWLDIMALGFAYNQPWERPGQRRHDAMEASARQYAGEPHGTPEAESHLYRNRGDGTFEDVSEKVGIRKFLSPMGANFGDLDNDGYLDFFVGTGNPNLWTLVPNVMMKNDAGRRFLDVTTAGGFGHMQKGHGIAFGDLDNDGQQDVFIRLGGFYEADRSAAALFANPGNDNGWITVRLEGTVSNRSAIGARLAFTIEESGKTRTIHRVTSTGGSFGSKPLRNEVGLGRARKVETLEVRWPSGKVEVFRDVPAGRFYVLREGGELAVDERVHRIPFPGGKSARLPS